jgi:hypothetical protein
VEGGEWSMDLETTFHFLLSTFEEMIDGGDYEETKKNQSLEGSFEKEKC